MRIESHGDIAILRIEAGSANAMSDAMLRWFQTALDQVQDARAVIVTGYPNYFSAGLDLPSLRDFDRDAMRDFIERFGDVMMRLHEWPTPVVAAISGHAVAGGCILALQADSRIIADGPYRVGVTAAQLGFGLPAVAIEVLRHRVAPRALAAVVLEGRTFSPAEALEIGLVDELVPSQSLESHALSRATELARTPPTAYRQLKEALRRPITESIRRHRTSTTDEWLSTWFSPEAQLRLQKAIARFTKR